MQSAAPPRPPTRIVRLPSAPGRPTRRRGGSNKDGSKRGDAAAAGGRDADRPPQVRRSLLWAGGLKDDTRSRPGQGYTGHAFNDYNHCDLCTMLGDVQDEGCYC